MPCSLRHATCISVIGMLVSPLSDWNLLIHASVSVDFWSLICVHSPMLSDRDTIGRGDIIMTAIESAVTVIAKPLSTDFVTVS